MSEACVMARLVEVKIGSWSLPGVLAMPDARARLVIFAHGSGSSRFSARNVLAAERLGDIGIATVLFDLSTEAEADDRRNVFDMPLLGARVVEAIDWARADAGTAALPIGMFRASAGAGAATVAAAARPAEVATLVSRGGRPDLAGEALAAVEAPTLLIVGGDDTEVLALNRSALARTKCKTSLAIVSGAAHLFEEPGALDKAMTAAGRWYVKYLH